jgi:transcriptional regulator with XRE-family HTH domain
VESITVSRWERGATSPSLTRLRAVATVTSSALGDLVRSEDGLSAHAEELAGFRRELAETRALVERVASALERLTRHWSAVD